MGSHLNHLDKGKDGVSGSPDCPRLNNRTSLSRGGREHAPQVFSLLVYFILEWLNDVTSSDVHEKKRVRVLSAWKELFLPPVKGHECEKRKPTNVDKGKRSKLNSGCANDYFCDANKVWNK